jgi:hypothetical protein
MFDLWTLLGALCTTPSLALAVSTMSAVALMPSQELLGIYSESLLLYFPELSLAKQI